MNNELDSFSSQSTEPAVEEPETQFHDIQRCSQLIVWDNDTAKEQQAIEYVITHNFRDALSLDHEKR